jgi:GNAT superfamily N-acetyltransferase
LEAAYHIVKQSVERLLANQLPAWLMPHITYEKQQARGENCGLFLEQRLGAVVTLSHSYRPQDWAAYLPETGFFWLGTLCVADEFCGQGIGQLALTQAEDFLRRQRSCAVWLDCYYGNGFLPTYYQANGYKWVQRKELIFVDGSLHDSVLMTKNLGPHLFENET